MIADLMDFREFMRIEHDHEDTLLETLLMQAQEAAESWCRTEFSEDEDVPKSVTLAIMMYAGYQYEHRAEPDAKGYAAMYQAFTDLLSPYSDPDRMF